MILFHHRTESRKPQFAGWLFLLLLIIFTVMIQFKLTVGLAGLGTTLLLGGMLVEVNAPRIWADSLKGSKGKKRRKGEWWRRPTQAYYALNTYVLWPAVMAAGVIALMVAYQLA